MTTFPVKTLEFGNELFLNDIPLDVESFTWSFTAGARPYKTQIQVIGDIGFLISQTKNPATISFKWSATVDAKNIHVFQGQITDVYITEIKQADQHFDIWELADKRLLWDGIKVTRYYNVHWGSYEAISLTPQAGRRWADFTLVQGKRYAKWSLRDPRTKKPAVPTSDEKFRGTVWTAMQILLDLLENVLGLKPNEYEVLAEDNGYQPENLIFEAESVQSALESVMALAHVNMYVDDSGRIVIFPLEPEDAERYISNIASGALDGTQYPIRKSFANVRPHKVRVLFEKEHEVLFKYEEEKRLGRTVVRNALPQFELENVLRLPDTVRIGKDVYYKGSWIEISQAIDLWNRDPVNPPLNPKVKFTLSSIRKYWFGQNRLEYMFSTDLRHGRVDEIWAARIAAIRQSFRRIYRVKPYWAQRIKQFRAERATLLDPVTGRRQPSPVWCDYLEVPSFRKIIKSRDKNKFVSARNILAYPRNGDFENARPVPVAVNMIDEQLGIFELRFLQDPLEFTFHQFFGEAENIPKLSAGMPPTTLLWTHTKLKDNFKLAVILSCIFAVPNSKAQKHVEEFDVPDSNPKLIWELYSTRDNARFRFTNNMRVDLKDNEIHISGAVLDNKDVIKAVAEAEKEQFLFSLRDRIICGTFIRLGYRQEWKPYGWIRSVSVTLGTRGIETHFVMPDPPKARPLITMLPARVKYILNKSILGREGL